MTAAPNGGPPAGDQAERVEQLRKYLAEHPGTRLIDLEQHRDPVRGPLYILAKRMLERGELVPLPNGALSFPRFGPIMEDAQRTAPLAGTGRNVLVRMLGDIKIRDSEGKDRDLHKEDVLTLPDSTAKALIGKGMAAKVDVASPIPANMPPAVPVPSSSIETGSGRTAQRTVRERQDAWLKVLQELAPQRPILVQITLPREGAEWKDWNDDTAALRTWLPVGAAREPYHALKSMTRAEYDALANGPCVTRGILINELVIDFDISDRRELEAQHARAVDVLRRWGWTAYSAPTGGKGIHLHAFIDPRVSIPEDLFQRIIELEDKKGVETDAWCHIRDHLFERLVREARLTVANAKEGRPGVDRAKVHWSKFSKGSPIRMVGCVRDNGRTKTLDPAGKTLIFPAKPPVLNDLTPFLPEIWNRIRADVDHNLSRDLAQIDLGGKAAELPCISGIVASGAPEGDRNLLWFAVAGLLHRTGTPEDRAEAMAREFARNSNASEQEMISTTRSAYSKRDPDPELERKLCWRIRKMGYTGHCVPGCPVSKAREEERTTGGGASPPVKQGRKASGPIEAKGFSLDLAEPYIEEDGSPAVAVIKNGREIVLKALDAWKREEPELGAYLETTFFKEGRRPLWRYPSRPVLPSSYDDIRQLHDDMQRCNGRYVEFPNTDWPSVFATWLIGSYLVPLVPRSPILPIFGPSESGKGQVLDQVDRLAYRGKKLISPTPAVMYRLADRWKMTFALDELQDLDRESFRAVLNIVKGSYDGTPVSRCDSNTGEVQEFQTRGFMALSFKGQHPPEDVKNRGVLLTMQRNGDPKSLVPEDSPEHQELRARLMGLRLKALSDPGFLEEVCQAVMEQGTPEALGFDRRSKDIAVSLLLPAIMSGQKDELIKIIKKSSEEARDENNSTFPAIVQHAYEELIAPEGSPNPYNVLSIRDHIQEQLRADGDLRDNEVLKTRKVTDALKTLGYEIRRKGKNIPYIDRETEQNRAALEINRRKYAVKEDGADTPEVC